MTNPKVGHIFRLAQIIQESCERCTDQEATSLAKAILEHPGSRWCPQQTPEPEGPTDEELDIAVIAIQRLAPYQPDGPTQPTHDIYAVERGREILKLHLAQWGLPAAPPETADFDPRLIALATTSEQIPPGPYSEHELRTQWNAQADEFNQWESLDLSEQLAWAQARAIAADRTRAELAQPPASWWRSAEPTNYSEDFWRRDALEKLVHAATSFRLGVYSAEELEIFENRARAILARWGPPAIEPEEKWYPSFADWLEGEMPEGTVIGDPLWWASKIATYLQRPAIEPVPVAEQPWERDGWCDAEGRCWMVNELLEWAFRKQYKSLDSYYFHGYTHLLPHWALPVPNTTTEAP